MNKGLLGFNAGWLINDRILFLGELSLNLKPS